VKAETSSVREIVNIQSWFAERMLSNGFSLVSRLKR